jgi:2-polyprenyl-3-methyl-5-hydroxy-6-metoxy-1,4-benzoquinol methylase
MPVLTPLRRSSQPELLDQLGHQFETGPLAGNLRNIRLANRWFGGRQAVLRELAPLIETQPADEPLTILDIATGSADIPLAIDDLAARLGRSVRIVATDLQPEVLEVARAAVGTRSIAIEPADALALPYDDARFDVVTLSLALHHFETEEATQVLREMGRVGRRLLIVNDLERSWTGLAGAWLFSHLLTTNPMTRNDAPLSVRRAYTAPEALALAHAAGWRAARVRNSIPNRYVLTGRPA